MAGLTIGRFAGIPPEAFRFYEELSDEGNNDRAWFDANRRVYERSVRLPLEELLDAAAGEFGADGKVFRPNRDVRFSRDKRPYKEHAGAVIGHRTGTDAPTYYVEVAAHGLRAAAGYHELSRDQLTRLRAAVDDGRRGGALVRAVALTRDRGLRVRGQELTRAPRGFSTDHPRIELLRHRWLTVERSWPVSRWMHTEEAYERITGVWRDAAPVTSWLRRHVGAPVEQVGRR